MSTARTTKEISITHLPSSNGPSLFELKSSCRLTRCFSSQARIARTTFTGYPTPTFHLTLTLRSLSLARLCSLCLCSVVLSVRGALLGNRQEASSKPARTTILRQRWVSCSLASCLHPPLPRLADLVRCSIRTLATVNTLLQLFARSCEETADD